MGHANINPREIDTISCACNSSINHDPFVSLSAPHLPFAPRPCTGLDHLLYDGRGVGGQREEAEELHVACFMGLVSFLAGRLEVLRIAPWHTKVLQNAAARANIQSATATSTPLTDSGLDGSGEIIQVGGCVGGSALWNPTVSLGMHHVFFCQGKYLPCA